MTKHTIKRRDELLQDIASGLKKLKPSTPVACINVTLRTGSESYEFGLAFAIEVLSSDLYFDERGNWADARTAEIKTL